MATTQVGSFLARANHLVGDSQSARAYDKTSTNQRPKINRFYLLVRVGLHLCHVVVLRRWQNFSAVYRFSWVRGSLHFLRLRVQLIYPYSYKDMLYLTVCNTWELEKVVPLHSLIFFLMYLCRWKTLQPFILTFERTKDYTILVFFCFFVYFSHSLFSVAYRVKGKA